MYAGGELLGAAEDPTAPSLEGESAQPDGELGLYGEVLTRKRDTDRWCCSVIRLRASWSSRVFCQRASERGVN